MTNIKLFTRKHELIIDYDAIGTSKQTFEGAKVKCMQLKNRNPSGKWWILMNGKLQISYNSER